MLPCFRICGAYEFEPGGEPEGSSWEGPTFVLTRTTGNCALVNEFAGVGNTQWTQLFRRLACLGPSTQYIYVSGLEGSRVAAAELQGTCVSKACVCISVQCWQGVAAACCSVCAAAMSASSCKVQHIANAHLASHVLLGASTTAEASAPHVCT
jgi:hypothetical protein